MVGDIVFRIVRIRIYEDKEPIAIVGKEETLALIK